MPPATAKLARPPDGPVIQPPPVTKSPIGLEHAAHAMSACEDEITTSASGAPPSGLETVTCSALTVISEWLPLAELDCSLITITPASFGRFSVWLGSPVTVIGVPLTTSPRISELPLALAPPAPSHLASARDDRTSAWIVLPTTLRLASATEASARLWLPWPTVAAWTTSASSASRLSVCCLEIVAERSVEWSAPPEASSGPASPTTIVGKASTVAWITLASPLNVVRVEDVSVAHRPHALRPAGV